MRLQTTTRGAMLLLGTALYGCISAPMPAPEASITAPDEPALSMAAPFEAPFEAPSALDVAIAQAQAQRKDGDYYEATRTLSQLMLVAPDDPRVLGEYGKTLLAKGETADALLFLARAIEFQPTDWTLFSALGVTYDHQGDFSSAQMAYNRALTLMPDEPSVLSNAGLSRMQAGDLEGAEAYLVQAVRAGGETPRIAQNLALIQDLKNSQARDRTAIATQEPIQAPGPAARSRGIAALLADPTVHMAPIPPPDPEPEPVSATSAPRALVAVLPAPKPADIERLTGDEPGPSEPPALRRMR